MWHHVIEEWRPSSGRWSDVDGLQAIPPEHYDRTQAVVAELNRRAGRQRYVILPDTTATMTRG